MATAGAVCVLVMLVGAAAPGELPVEHSQGALQACLPAIDPTARTRQLRDSSGSALAHFA